MIDRVVKTCYNNLGVSGSVYTYSIYKIISICLLMTAQGYTIDSLRFYYRQLKILHWHPLVFTEGCFFLSYS